MKYTEGSIIVTQFPGYKHFSIVTGRMCSNGKAMLISATRRNGTVKEEAWDVVTDGKETSLVRKCGSMKEALSIMKRARSEIGKWEYSLVAKNCEHFVNWAVTGELSSKQVSNGLIGGGLGAVGVALLLENPKAGKVVLGGLLCAMLAVTLTKAEI